MAENIVNYYESTTQTITNRDGTTRPAIERGKSTNGIPLTIPVELYNSDGTAGKTAGTTGYPRHLNDVANYTDHYTQGAVSTAELSTLTWTAGEDVTAILVNPWGGSAFKGVYLTVNAPDDATAALRLKSDNTSGSTDTIRYFVPAGSPRLLKFSSAITRVDLVAIDAEGAEDNNVEVEPY